MRCDLHSHSSLSDGMLSLPDLVAFAAERNLQMLAVTDHDVVHARADFEAAARPGLQVVPGIEISCTWGPIAIHVVGLGVAPDNATLRSAIDSQSAVREKRAVLISERLAKQGIPDLLAQAKQIAGDGVIGRPHFARAMVERGVVSDEPLAFRKYLGRGKAGDIKHLWPELTAGINWVHAAGGLAVLAHPLKYKLSRGRLRALCGYFKAEGGDGIEVVSGRQAPGDTTLMADLAVEHRLLGSSGSDFHGPGYPWQDLGRLSALPERVAPIWRALCN